MSDLPASDVVALVDELLSCPAENRAAWLDAHRSSLSPETLEELKRRTDDTNRSDPELANRASSCALLAADYLPDEPLARPLAAWTRGNWAIYNVPRQAVALYHTALAGYRSADQPLIVA